MVKIYKQPFAHAGAKQVIPDASDPQGFVSNTDGFTTDYELPDTDPNYKPIERAEFNGLMNMVTESLGEIQQFGFAKWQSITWPQGARVVEGGVVYRALVQTSQQPPHADWVEDIGTTQIGAILCGYTVFDNCIVAFGGEFNRADYPKLWAYLQANPILVKTQAQWQTEATANGGICGFFSDGDGTTTFRVPNLDKAFLRPDSRTVGSFQEGSYTAGDATGTSPSSVALLNYDDNISAFKSRMNWDSLSTVTIGETNLKFSGNNATLGPDNYQNSPGFFGVTRPKNIAVLPLILAK